MLDSAVLCALAEISAGFVRIDPHTTRMIRDEVVGMPFLPPTRRMGAA